MAKTKQKKVATTNYLEKHKYTLVNSRMGVLRTNLDLDQVLIMLDPLSEDEAVDFQVVNQSTGELYAVEKHIKLVNTNLENQD